MLYREIRDDADGGRRRCYESRHPNRNIAQAHG